MMTQNADKKREQIHLLCMDEMVPQDHLLRIIDTAMLLLLYQNDSLYLHLNPRSEPILKI